ncbi:related to glycerol-3-phosphate dehydrogenase precursor [Cephalotrichum gorgonifer]|uniref:Glycerol-3-phosphate dehydrogenase n=1 Tax=Cephalotrichum gorgonifer TaxID=2041049 RepID=A0AAE8T0F4_9PEZI|nr:related to glycerol-3-phosphate dehydrogenase precursor [Cephalotrichum gorgonifer]
MSKYQRILRPALGVTGAVAVGTYAYSKTSSPKTPILPVAELKRDSSNRIITPSFPEVKSRTEQLAELRGNGAASAESGEQYDLLIIGGGATGTGIALDAVTRGLKVALVERDDFSAGTSSKSTKLVHGGVRYLEKAVWNLDYAQLQLVMEALSERKTFLTIAPHLSRSQPILLPLSHWWQAPYMWIGTKMYDMLAGSQNLESSYYMSKAESLKRCPLLRQEGLVGSLAYYDGQHNDSRMNVGLAMTASLYGATVLNHVEITGLEKGADGKIRGARARDLLSPDAQGSSEFTISAKGVINATGPFADAIEQMDNPSKKPIVAPASGVHIVLPKNICPNGMGLLNTTSDGRVIFVLPWEGSTIAGTTDNACEVEENPVPSLSDVDFILKETNKLLRPDSALTHKDVLATWSGIRPLIKDPHAKNTESLVRSHLITVSPAGLLTCAGGKWTTYREMSEEAVDQAIKSFNLKPTTITLPDVSGANLPSLTTNGECQTRSIRLAGAHGFTSALESQIAETHDVQPDIAHHLATNYGDRAWAVLSSESPSALKRLLPQFPFIEAEIAHGIRAEAACTAVDVIARRMRLSFLDVNGALSVLPRVVDLMAVELQWDGARKEKELKQSIQFLESMGLGQEKMRAEQKVSIKVKGEEGTRQTGPVSALL